MFKYRFVLGAAAMVMLLAGCGAAAVEQGANQALATVEANLPAGAEQTAADAVQDPTVQALAEDIATTAEAALDDPEVQAALDEAFAGASDQFTLEAGQALDLGSLTGMGNVTNYRLVITDAPEGAGGEKNQVIKEASNGNVSINPDEYAKYFTVPGEYRIRMTVTTDDGRKASRAFTINVP